MMPHHPIRKLAILAGSGTAPQKASLMCDQNRIPYVYIALEGYADPAFTPQTQAYFQRPLGYVGAILELLQQNQVKDVMLIGGVKRPSWSSFKVDEEGRRWLGLWGRRIFQGDAGLLNLVSTQMTALGYRLIGLHELIPQMTVPYPGALTDRVPSEEVLEDIRMGQRLLQSLSPYDMGQAAVIHQGVVLGVEGPEGTDRLIERCASLRNAPSGGVLVKSPKTHQDRRLDLPVIGPDTVQSILKHHFSGIALQTGEVMVLDQEHVIRLLNHHKGFLYAFSPSL